jgi:hypothetical protein
MLSIQQYQHMPLSNTVSSSRIRSKVWWRVTIAAIDVHVYCYMLTLDLYMHSTTLLLLCW